MALPSNKPSCKTCGAPAMQGLQECARCLAEGILHERIHGNPGGENMARKAAAKRREALIGVVVVAAVLLAGFIFFAVINSASWQYKTAAERDSVTAYESFLKKHGKSAEASKARARAAELDYARTLEYPHLSGLREFIEKWPGSREEAHAKAEILRIASERWLSVKDSHDPGTLQRFISDHPEAKEIPLASARVKNLSILHAWDLIKNRHDLQALANHAKNHPGHETAALAKQRIDALCNNYDWVKRQDKLPIYRAYLKQNPNSPHKAAVEKRIIDLEVSEILAGEHGELPPASPVRITGGSTVAMEIENATAHTLTVRYSGNQSYRFDLPPRTTREFSVAADTYRVAASVASPGITPYAGRDTMQGGSYSSKFYIKTGFR